jgi:hypothetical protein
MKDTWVFVPNQDETCKALGKVARVCVGSGYACLDCGVRGDYRYSTLGVFLVKKISKKSKE